MSSYRNSYTDLEVVATTNVGDSLSGNTLAVANSEIGNAELNNNAASGLKVSPGFGTVSAGSPAAVGRSTYAGTSATGGGSDAWVVFPGANFAAAPTAIIPVNMKAMANEGNTFFIPAGSITAGSFYIQSSVASTDFAYVAIGSGRF